MGSETMKDRQMGFIGRGTRKIRVSEWAEAAETNMRAWQVVPSSMTGPRPAPNNTVDST